MDIIPAIDLRGGKCVRLYQGDYSKETVFSDNPVEMARLWQSRGASRLHIVDLDGAAQGNLQHASIIESMVHSVIIPMQLGGGLRTIDSISKALDLGVARVILGTAAIENEPLIQEACRRFSNLIIVGIDAMEGCVSTRGWKQSTSVKAIELARNMLYLGVPRFIYTDISRDGTLTEPNFETISEMVQSIEAPIIAAGGISSIEHLEKLSDIGVEGAIVGRALYTGDIDLVEALKNVK